MKKYSYFVYFLAQTKIAHLLLNGNTVITTTKPPKNVGIVREWQRQIEENDGEITGVTIANIVLIDEFEE